MYLTVFTFFVVGWSLPHHHHPTVMDAFEPIFPRVSPEQAQFRAVCFFTVTLNILKLFKKVKYYVSKCIDNANDPNENCYNDLFNSDYVWA